jgi:hypothetical protein
MRNTENMSDDELSKALDELAYSMFMRGQWDFSLDLVKEASKRLKDEEDTFGL